MTEKEEIEERKKLAKSQRDDANKILAILNNKPLKQIEGILHFVQNEINKTRDNAIINYLSPEAPLIR